MKSSNKIFRFLGVLYGVKGRKTLNYAILLRLLTIIVVFGY